MTVIPDDLAEYVSEFRLPTGALIRRMTSRDHDLEGWMVDLGAHRYLYRDGSREGLPRHRAFNDLGCPGGEDDLRTDDDWKRVDQRIEQLSHLLIGSLEGAWALAREHGAANRHARLGETARVRDTDAEVTVINPGTDHGQDGQFVRVRDADGDEFTMKLMDLVLPD